MSKRGNQVKIKNLKQKLIDERSRTIFYPRLQMAVVLSLTGLAGFLTSLALLHFGMTRLWLRYPLAIVTAYACFLGLLYLWISFHRQKTGLDLVSEIGIPIDSGIGTAGSGTGDDVFSGAGDFGGGGAGGTFDAGAGAPVSTSIGSPLEGVSIDLDLEELGLVLLGIALILGGLVASLYVVYIAPVLLAEILVDALLVGGLYKRVRKIDRRHWLETALRKTWLPALLCAAAFAIAGFLFQWVLPEAHTVGEVLRTVFS